MMYTIETTTPAVAIVAEDRPASASRESMVIFDPSQRRFFEDTARVLVVNWHRQKGKDFTAAAKAVEDALSTGRDWFIVSLTQRQADATFSKCKMFVKAFKAMLRLVGEATYSDRDFIDFDKSIDQHFVCKAREIVFPNGARVVSLPGRDPDTLAGLTGNVIFTEFGLFPKGGYDHWSVIFPITTRGYQVIVISTPRGKDTKFYELWSDRETYSVHTCDIHQSVEQEGFVLRDNKGMPCTIEQFRRLYNDESKWPREYGCQFTGDLSALIKWAQLEQAAALGLGLSFRVMEITGEAGFQPDLFSGVAQGGWLNIGWDVARTGDLSVATVNVRRNGKPDHLAAMALMRNTPFALQRRVVISAMDAGNGRSAGAGDNTGLGMDSNETLTTKYRDRWEGVNFGGSRKMELASGLATAFGDGAQTLPSMAQHKYVATDVYAIQKDDTGAKVVIDQTENPLLPDSHCDIAWSLALAHYAGTKNNLAPLPASTQKRPAGW